MGDHIKYYDGYKYVLAEDYSILTPIVGYHALTSSVSLAPDGNLTIRKGFPWDGASGPALDTKSSMRGSLVHDALYQLERDELISMKERPAIDRLLRDICIEDGMWKWRANLWLWIVRRFGVFSAIPEFLHPPQVAP